MGTAGAVFLESRLPEVLKSWEPKQKQYLPASDWLYTQREAAKAWGIPLPQWWTLSLPERVEMVGHELEHARREGYIVERMKEEAGEEDEGKNRSNSFMDMRREIFAKRGKQK